LSQKLYLLVCAAETDAPGNAVEISDTGT